ncbi:hypothetical protein COCON_G00176930 [Conger conger]|uniref:Secreted protein n=1 Tax=Conger conger TaxID=82655 RepID=A0A9Q1D4Z3_CONCO|nr:hypothetical protein COCON_G00176930 [Conger conger]
MELFSRQAAGRLCLFLALRSFSPCEVDVTAKPPSHAHPPRMAGECLLPADWGPTPALGPISNSQLNPSCPYYSIMQFHRALTPEPYRPRAKDRILTSRGLEILDTFILI